MVVSRYISKSCCGNSGTITLYSDKPIKAHQIEIFKTAGYTLPEHYIKSGVFYCKKDNFSASTSFGMTKFHIRCSSANREEKISEFEKLLEQAINS